MGQTLYPWPSSKPRIPPRGHGKPRRKRHDHRPKQGNAYGGKQGKTPEFPRPARRQHSHFYWLITAYEMWLDLGQPDVPEPPDTWPDEDQFPAIVKELGLEAPNDAPATRRQEGLVHGGNPRPTEESRPVAK